MDPLAAVLCGVGAAFLLLRGGTELSFLPLLLLGGALYGVGRATRSPHAVWLLVAPPFLWIFSSVRSLAPQNIAMFADPLSVLNIGLHWLSTVVLIAALVGSLLVARSRVGGGLSNLAIGALGISLLAQTVSLPFHDPFLGQLLRATGMGWFFAGSSLTGIAWLIVGMAPPPPLRLPRRGGAFVGATGASLLYAIHTSVYLMTDAKDEAALVIVFFMFVAWVLIAIGVGGIAGNGVSSGWVGVGLVVLQILLIPISMIFKTTYGQLEISLIVKMTVPFGLLGIGMTMLVAKAFPFPAVRRLIALLCLLSAAASVGGWLAYIMGQLRHTPNYGSQSAPSIWMVGVLTSPALNIGLLLWMAYVAFLTAPPLLQASKA